MSGISSPETDTSVYNSALDTTLNRSGRTFCMFNLGNTFLIICILILDEDTSNASINDVSSFKSDLDSTGSTINDEILGSNISTSLSDNLQSISGSKSLNQGQNENVNDASLSSNGNRSKVTRSLFNETNDELNGPEEDMVVISEYN